jgi:hypothetical protein
VGGNLLLGGHGGSSPERRRVRRPVGGRRSWRHRAGRWQAEAGGLHHTCSPRTRPSPAQRPRRVVDVGPAEPRAGCGRVQAVALDEEVLEATQGSPTRMVVKQLLLAGLQGRGGQLVRQPGPLCPCDTELPLKDATSVEVRLDARAGECSRCQGSLSPTSHWAITAQSSVPTTCPTIHGSTCRWP